MNKTNTQITTTTLPVVLDALELEIKERPPSKNNAESLKLIEIRRLEIAQGQTTQRAEYQPVKIKEKTPRLIPATKRHSDGSVWLLGYRRNKRSRKSNQFRQLLTPKCIQPATQTTAA